MGNKRANKTKKQKNTESLENSKRVLCLAENIFWAFFTVMFYVLITMIAIFIEIMIFKISPVYDRNLDIKILLLFFGIFIILNQWRLNK